MARIQSLAKSRVNQRVIATTASQHQELLQLQRRLSFEQERSIPMHEVIAFLLAK